MHSAASDLGLHGLPMSHKKDTMLIWVKWDAKSIESCKNGSEVSILIWFQVLAS